MSMASWSLANACAMGGFGGFVIPCALAPPAAGGTINATASLDHNRNRRGV
jgi:hypothetical protein